MRDQRFRVSDFEKMPIQFNAPQHIPTHCNTLHHTASHCTHCNTLQHTATYVKMRNQNFSALHVASHYNTHMNERLEAQRVVWDYQRKGHCGWKDMCVFLCVDKFLCVCVCVNPSLSLSLPLSLSVCACVCLYMYVYAFACVCMFMHVRVCVWEFCACSCACVLFYCPTYVTWHMHMRDMTQKCVWHDPFVCETWLIRMRDMMHSYVRQDLFVHVTWPFRASDLIHTYV